MSSAEKGYVRPLSVAVSHPRKAETAAALDGVTTTPDLCHTAMLMVWRSYKPAFLKKLSKLNTSF
jgi:hypothetical protein